MRALSQSFIAVMGMFLGCAAALAQPAPQATPEGVSVFITGNAALEVDNDEAVANFYLELQDAELAKAQSLLNTRVAEALTQIKRIDPKAQLETGSHGAYPVYANAVASSKGTAINRNIVAWRVRQGVTVRSLDLAVLPKVLAAGQQVLALSGVQFRVSSRSREKYEAELIRRAIANLNDKVAAAAQALGVPAQKVRLENLNFGGRMNEAPIAMAYAQAQARGAVADMASDAPVESGKTTLHQSVDGRVRLLLP